MTNAHLTALLNHPLHMILGKLIGVVKNRVFFCSCPCGQNKPPSSRLVETVQDLHGTGQLLCHSKWPQKWPLGLGHALKVTNSPFNKSQLPYTGNTVQCTALAQPATSLPFLTPLLCLGVLKWVSKTRLSRISLKSTLSFWPWKPILHSKQEAQNTIPT